MSGTTTTGLCSDCNCERSSGAIECPNCGSHFDPLPTAGPSLLKDSGGNPLPEVDEVSGIAIKDPDRRQIDDLLFAYRDGEPNVANNWNTLELRLTNPFAETMHDLVFHFSAANLTFEFAKKSRNELTPQATWTFEIPLKDPGNMKKALLMIGFSYKTGQGRKMPYKAEIFPRFFTPDELDTKVATPHIQVADHGGVLYKAEQKEKDDYHITRVKRINEKAKEWQPCHCEFDQFAFRENENKTQTNNLKKTIASQIEHNEYAEAERNLIWLEGIAPNDKDSKQLQKKISGQRIMAAGAAQESREKVTQAGFTWHCGGRQGTVWLYAMEEITIGRKKDLNHLVVRYEPYDQLTHPDNYFKTKQISRRQGTLRLLDGGLFYSDEKGNSKIDDMVTPVREPVALAPQSKLVLPGGMILSFSYYFSDISQLTLVSRAQSVDPANRHLFGIEGRRQPFSAVRINRTDKKNDELCHIILLRDIYIGKHPSCTLHLDHHSIKDSHARLFYSQGGFYLTNLDETNGLSINGKMIDISSEHRLADHDRIVLSDDVEGEFMVCHE